MTSGARGWSPLFDTPDGGLCPSLEELSAEMREAVIQAAADMLWHWTGRVFGVCEVEIRPCRGDRGGRAPSTFEGSGPVTRIGHYGHGGNSPWLASLVSGDGRVPSCGDCLGSDACSCDGPTTLALPGPVYAVDEITIDGTALDPSAYEVRSRRLLVRTDGGVWPTTQAFDRPLGEPGTWGISYRKGVALPPGGRLALGAFACELARAYVGDEDCALPQRIQSVTRQGVSVAVMDSFEGLDDGRTGIWAIDSWVASVSSARAPSAVRSPDYRPRERGFIR